MAIANYYSLFSLKQTYTRGILVGIFFCFLIMFLLRCSPKTAPMDEVVIPEAEFTRPGEAEMPDRWWEELNDPLLDSLIEQSFSGNLNLKSFYERIRAAWAIQDGIEGNRIPDINANLQTAVSFPQPDFVGGENTRIGLRANYEVDFWGNIGARIDAEKYRSQARVADFQAGVISVSAEIATNYYRLVAAKQLEDLSLRQIRLNNQVAELLRNRYGTGLVTAVDILRQRQLIQSVRELLIQTEGDIAILENRLQVLTGELPGNKMINTIDSLPVMPPLPSTGVPAELITRRPDIQVAYLELLGADRDLAAAISAKYPRLSISASTSLRTNDINSLFDNWAYSFAGNILAPIFYGGELQSEVDRTEAVRSQLLYEYGQATLLAFEEVENALILEEKQKERVETIKAQLDLSLTSWEQLRIAYFNGLVDYLDVLNALTQTQQLERNLIIAQRSLLEIRIGLYRALAGRVELDINNSDPLSSETDIR